MELVAVIAVTAVVCAVGYSAYRTHAVRTQVAAGIAAAKPIQVAVAEAFRSSGEAPSTVGLERAASPGPFVASLTVDDGRIDVLYGREADPAIAERRLSLTPYETAGREVVWVCGNDIPGPGLHPLGFAGGGRQAAQIATTIEVRYLPPGCR